MIRPEVLATDPRRRPRRVALAMVAVGLAAIALAFVGPPSALRVGILACIGAIGIGVGSAWLIRVVRPDHARRRSDALVSLLATVLPDDYTLVVQPRLPVPDGTRLDGILVGPGGVRVITVREWHGQYRVRGRSWEFDSRGRHGWIRCRTNPSSDAVALTTGVQRWAAGTSLPELGLRPLIVFPHSHSKVTLEEPAEEVVTTDNAPWWANAFGRAQRLNQAGAARVVQVILDASEPGPAGGFSPAPDRGP